MPFSWFLTFNFTTGRIFSNFGFLISGFSPQPYPQPFYLFHHKKRIEQVLFIIACFIDLVELRFISFRYEKSKYQEIQATTGKFDAKTENFEEKGSC
jgi:hypothetical protein